MQHKPMSLGVLCVAHALPDTQAFITSPFNELLYIIYYMSV
jgi:hypothetical protein